MLIVYDSDHPLARNNECFKDEAETAGAGAYVAVALRRAAELRGARIVTGDVFLGMPSHSTEAILISDMVSRATENITRLGTKPGVCFSLESPLFARKFYQRVTRYAG